MQKLSVQLPKMLEQLLKHTKTLRVRASVRSSAKQLKRRLDRIKKTAREGLLVKMLMKLVKRQRKSVILPFTNRPFVKQSLRLIRRSLQLRKQKPRPILQYLIFIRKVKTSMAVPTLPVNPGWRRLRTVAKTLSTT